MLPYPQFFNVNILSFCILSHAFWVNLFTLFLSIIHSITIHFEISHEYKLYFHLSDGLETSGTHQHYCHLSSLRRQQYLPTAPYLTATTKSALAIPWPKSPNATDKMSTHWLHGITFPTPHKSKSAKYCASAVMLPHAALQRSNAKPLPLPRSTDWTRNGRPITLHPPLSNATTAQPAKA